MVVICMTFYCKKKKYFFLPNSDFDPSFLSLNSVIKIKEKTNHFSENLVVCLLQQKKSLCVQDAQKNLFHFI